MTQRDVVLNKASISRKMYVRPVRDVSVFVWSSHAGCIKKKREIALNLV